MLTLGVLENQLWMRRADFDLFAILPYDLLIKSTIFSQIKELLMQNMFTGPNTMFRQGNSVLQNAVVDAGTGVGGNSLTTLTQLLNTNKAQINAPNKNGYSCLDLARSLLNPQLGYDANQVNTIIKLLVQNGAKGLKTAPTAIESTAPKLK